METFVLYIPVFVLGMATGASLLYLHNWFLLPTDAPKTIKVLTEDFLTITLDKKIPENIKAVVNEQLELDCWDLLSDKMLKELHTKVCGHNHIHRNWQISQLRDKGLVLRKKNLNSNHNSQ